MDEVLLDTYKPSNYLSNRKVMHNVKNQVSKKR
jgi:hypothetical protein